MAISTYVCWRLRNLNTARTSYWPLQSSYLLPTISGNIITDVSDNFSQFCILTSRRQKKQTDKTLIFSSQKMDDCNSKLAQYCSNKYLNWPSPVFGRFQNGCNKVVIEPRVVQFWSEIILVISNRTRAARSFDFEITRMISAQIALHSVQLPLLIKIKNRLYQTGNCSECKSYRNKIITLTRLSKKQYYFDFF